MKCPLQKAPFILTHAALLAVIAAMAHAQSAAPVLLAKFVGTLNTKAAKAGDAVVAMTEKPAKMADGKEIPKGAPITGKVAAVKSKNDGNGNSTLAIKFDQIEVKGARLPIEGQIVAIGHRSETDTPDNSYLGIGHSTPTMVIDPVSSILDKSGSSHDSLGIAAGSTLPGVTVTLHLNDADAVELNGYKRDFKLDSSVLVKVKLN
jgi:hypothetical protein